MNCQENLSECNDKPKTAKQLEKEKQKLAKLEKFKQKQEKKKMLCVSKPKEKLEV
jgi:valyl-tRNA synthetase